MIVFLNADKKKVDFYSENGKISYSFYNTKAIETLLKNHSVTYVTECMDVDGTDILELISQLSEGEEQSQSNQFYLFSKIGDIIIGDIGVQIQKDKFISLDQFKEEFGEDILKKNPSLNKMISEGHLVVVDKFEAEEIQNQIQQKAENMTRQRDEWASRDVMEGDVKSMIEQAKRGESVGDFGGLDIAASFDIEGGGMGGSGGKPMAAKNNEASLIPGMPKAEDILLNKFFGED